MREWKKIEGFDFKEIIFEEYHHIAKITINRERYRNAFTPLTTWEMSQAFSYCRESQNIRVVILTGAGDKAFCAGGDMHVKGRGGYVGTDGVPRLNVLDVQMQIRRLPKPVIAMVNGYAIGGGHVLHVMCDLTIASENAIFGQTGPKVVRLGVSFVALPVAPLLHGLPDYGVQRLRNARRMVPHSGVGSLCLVADNGVAQDTQRHAYIRIYSLT